jgi:hypothetical protein
MEESMVKQTGKRSIPAGAPLAGKTAPRKQTHGTKATDEAKSANSELLATLVRLEKRLWKKFTTKDKVGFAAMVTDDYTEVAVGGFGERDLQGTLDSFQDITIDSYALSDFRLTKFGSSAALLRYNVSAKGSLGSQEFSGRLAVGEIWMKRGGQWKSFRYQATIVN